MGRKILFSFSLIFLCTGFSLTLDQILARKNVSFISRTSPNKEVVVNSDRQNSGDMKPVQNFTVIPITQALNYNLSRRLEKEPRNAFSHHSPVNVSMDGIPCILFWAKRITIKFKNQTWLDLTDEAIGQKATVDAGNSKCSEESAMLSLKFGDAENPRGLDIRFALTSYKLSIQRWYSLHRVEVIFNNSIQATFNATGIYAPSSYSYHCQRVSSLQADDALLLPSDTSDMSSLWEVTFVDFQEEDTPFAIALRNTMGTQCQNFWKVFQQLWEKHFQSLAFRRALEGLHKDQQAFPLLSFWTPSLQDKAGTTSQD